MLVQQKEGVGTEWVEGVQSSGGVSADAETFCDESYQGALSRANLAAAALDTEEKTEDPKA